MPPIIRLSKLLVTFTTLMSLSGGTASEDHPTADHFQHGISTRAHVRCSIKDRGLFVRNETLGFDRVENLNALRGTYEQDLYRPCWCTEYYTRPVEYCADSLDTCIVYGVDGPVECLSHSGVVSLAQTVFPTGFFYVCLVLLVFACTQRGVYLRQFIRRKLCRPTTMTEEDVLNQFADTILNRDGRHHLLHQARLRLSNAAAASTTETRPKQMKVKCSHILKLKSFLSLSDELAGDDGVHECAICLSAIEDGERVGDIPCGHLFHKDCLKMWLNRRKRCPLCQDEDLVKRLDESNDVAKKEGDEDLENAESETAAPSSRRGGLSTTLAASDTISEAGTRDASRVYNWLSSPPFSGSMDLPSSETG